MRNHFPSLAVLSAVSVCVQTALADRPLLEENRSKGPVFKKGVWQKVRIQVKLNTPGKADGQFAVHVDGKPVNQQSGIKFRAGDGKDTMISKMLFSTFHGGNSPGNAPKDDKGQFITVHADFDNFLVTEGW